VKDPPGLQERWHLFPQVDEAMVKRPLVASRGRVLIIAAGTGLAVFWVWLLRRGEAGAKIHGGGSTRGRHAMQVSSNFFVM
jgi:hypothetical protein